MACQEVALTIYPEHRVVLALYENVRNSAEVKKKIMSGEIIGTLLNPSMVVDCFQVLSAANKALHLHKHDKMITRSLHSEVLYCLSGSKKISEAFKKFGMADKATAIFVAVLCEGKENPLENLDSHIQGDRVSLDNLHKHTDIEEVKKIYKLTEPEIATSSLVDAIVGRIASKDFVTF